MRKKVEPVFCPRNMCLQIHHHITLDPRLPFPDSVGGIFPGPSATIQRVYNHTLKNT